MSSEIVDARVLEGRKHLLDEDGEYLGTQLIREETLQDGKQLAQVTVSAALRLTHLRRNAPQGRTAPATTIPKGPYTGEALCWAMTLPAGSKTSRSAGAVPLPFS